MMSIDLRGIIRWDEQMGGWIEYFRLVLFDS